MKLSRYLFWDANPDNLDYEKHARHIIERVVTRGKLEDWFTIQEFYGRERIKKEVVRIRSMDAKTMVFLSTILDIPQTEFRCYEDKQSYLRHYPY